MARCQMLGHRLYIKLLVVSSADVSGTAHIGTFILLEKEIFREVNG